MTATTHNYTCYECNEVFLTLDDDYVAQNPNASDIYIDQMRNQHLQNCDAVQEEEYSCPDCGEVYASINPGYINLNPNGSDIYIAQLWREHQSFCPGDEQQQALEASVNQSFGNRTLSREDYRYYYHLHRLHQRNEGEGMHFRCFHFMLNQKYQNEISASERLNRNRRIRRARR